jgi:hypothetical protein
VDLLHNGLAVAIIGLAAQVAEAVAEINAQCGGPAMKPLHRVKRTKKDKKDKKEKESPRTSISSPPSGTKNPAAGPVEAPAASSNNSNVPGFSIGSSIAAKITTATAAVPESGKVTIAAANRGVVSTANPDGSKTVDELLSSGKGFGLGANGAFGRMEEVLLLSLGGNGGQCSRLAQVR